MKKNNSVGITERPLQYIVLFLQILLFAAVRIILSLRVPTAAMMAANLSVAFDSIGIVIDILLYFNCIQVKQINRVQALLMHLLSMTSAFLAFDALCWMLDGLPRFRLLNIAMNSAVYVCFLLLVNLLFHYVVAWIDLPYEKIPVETALVNWFTVLGILAVVGNLFFGYYFKVSENGFYSHGQGFFFSYIGPVAMIVVTDVLVLRMKLSGRTKLMLVCYPTLPLFVMALTALLSGASMNYVAVFCAMVLLFSGLYVRQEQDLQRQKLLFRGQRYDLLASQIQSHFVSNTLLTIKGLYREDPEAGDAIMDDFISYIQHNFKDLGGGDPIPVSEELEHARRYTNIEQARFPDITAEYITEENCDPAGFLLPALTVQPLVENAIRHGLMPLESGGRVTVTVGEDADGYLLTVTDNGVGFDPAAPVPTLDDHRPHIGLPNIRDRLTVCGGSLTVESRVGEGTTVTVRMPKGEDPKKI